MNCPARGSFVVVHTLPLPSTFAIALQDWPSCYVQVCYEVGGDVFSLQELEHCVLRGKLPRPNPKDLPKRFAPVPPVDDQHYHYTLAKVRRLRNFRVLFSFEYKCMCFCMRELFIPSEATLERSTIFGSFFVCFYLRIFPPLFYFQCTVLLCS